MGRLMKEIIIEKINNQGRITFSDYMYSVLYDVEAGYYTTKNNVLGPEGDFYTSAHAGSILGEALAEVFIRDVASNKMFSILEYGAGEGKIALAFLNHLEMFYSEIYKKTVFFIVELSNKMRSLQTENLQEHKGKVFWINSVHEIKPFKGMIYANEFLDALPVHIIKYNKNELKEMYVTIKEKNIYKEYLPLSEYVKSYQHYLPVLPIGSETEFCVAAFDWLKEISDCTINCNVYLIDYGYILAQKNTPARRKKTSIRCYKNHQVFDNPFAEIGNRDITADVDFTTIQNVAKALGFNNEYLVTQGKFVFQSGLIEKITAGRKDFQQVSESESKLRHLKQLIFPGAMGEVFNVLKFYK